MKNILFDVECVAAIRVDASSIKKAREMLVNALDCADVNFGSLPNGDPIIGEVSERVIRVAEIDGKEYPGPNAMKLLGEPTRKELCDALSESLSAWEGEEDSVKEEHAELIRDLTKLLARVQS